MNPDTRYAQLQYAPEVDDRLTDAAARCASDCRIGQPAEVARFYPFGVVEAFASMQQVAPNCYLPRAAVVLWTAAEFLTVCELVGEMRP